MSLKIRLARGGAKKAPYYRLVVTNSRSPRDSKFIEKLGAYDPQLEKGDAKRFQCNEERVKHWLSVGAIPSETAARFLRQAGIYKTKPTYTAKAKGTGVKKNKGGDAAAPAAA
jgi:small subunit ribosomal protein S16